MSQRILQIVLRIILILLAVFLALCMVALVAGMIEGSLEMYPTPEEVSGARMACGMILLPVCTAEVIVLSRLFRKK